MINTAYPCIDIILQAAGRILNSHSWVFSEI